MAILLAFLSSVTFGASDFVGGLVSRRTAALLVVLWSQVVGLGVGVAGAALLPGRFDPGVVGWGAGAGLAGSVGLVLLYRGLAQGRMAVVAPTSAVMSAVVPILIGVASGERPRPLAWVGVGAGLAAVWLVVGAVGLRGGAAGFGVAAGLGFGLFFVMLARAPAAGGLWPLVPARMASLVMLLGLLAISRDPWLPPAQAVPALAVIGAGDMVANMLFLAAAQRGLLALVALVTSLYPAVTVALARLVLAEPIAPRQWVGLGLAVAALALIAG